MELEIVDTIPSYEYERLLIEFLSRGKRYAKVTDDKVSTYRLAKIFEEVINREDSPDDLKKIKIRFVQNNVYLVRT